MTTIPAPVTLQQQNNAATTAKDTTDSSATNMLLQSTTHRRVSDMSSGSAPSSIIRNRTDNNEAVVNPFLALVNAASAASGELEIKKESTFAEERAVNDSIEDKSRAPQKKLPKAKALMKRCETDKLNQVINQIAEDESKSSDESVVDAEMKQQDAEDQAKSSTTIVRLGTREDLRTALTKKMTFAEHLMLILDSKDHQDVLTWMPNGEAFTIVNHKKFCLDKMPKLFNIRNMSSFVRKLGRWGFARVHETGNSDIFKHPYFVRGKPDLCRQRVKCVGRTMTTSTNGETSEVQKNVVSQTSVVASRPPDLVQVGGNKGIMAMTNQASTVQKNASKLMSTSSNMLQGFPTGTFHDRPIVLSGDTSPSLYLQQQQQQQQRSSMLLNEDMDGNMMRSSYSMDPTLNMNSSFPLTSFDGVSLAQRRMILQRQRLQLQQQMSLGLMERENFMRQQQQQQQRVPQMSAQQGRGFNRSMLMQSDQLSPQELLDEENRLLALMERRRMMNSAGNAYQSSSQDMLSQNSEEKMMQRRLMMEQQQHQSMMKRSNEGQPLTSRQLAIRALLQEEEENRLRVMAARLRGSGVAPL